MRLPIILTCAIVTLIVHEHGVEAKSDDGIPNVPLKQQAIGHKQIISRIVLYCNGTMTQDESEMTIQYTHDCVGAVQMFNVTIGILTTALFVSIVALYIYSEYMKRQCIDNGNDAAYACPENFTIAQMNTHDEPIVEQNARAERREMMI